MRSPPGAGSCELMISFTLPIAFSVICTMLLFAPEISGLPRSPLYRRRRDHTNCQSFRWRGMEFGRGKFDPEQHRSPKTRRWRPHPGEPCYLANRIPCNPVVDIYVANSEC